MGPKSKTRTLCKIQSYSNLRVVGVIIDVVGCRVVVLKAGVAMNKNNNNNLLLLAGYWCSTLHALSTNIPAVTINVGFILMTYIVSVLVS